MGKKICCWSLARENVFFKLKMKRNSKKMFEFSFVHVKNLFVHFFKIIFFASVRWVKAKKEEICILNKKNYFQGPCDFLNWTHKNLPDQQKRVHFRKWQNVANHSTLTKSIRPFLYLNTSLYMKHNPNSISKTFPHNIVELYRVYSIYTVRKLPHDAIV